MSARQFPDDQPVAPGRTTLPGIASSSTSTSRTIGTPFTIVQKMPLGRAE